MKHILMALFLVSIIFVSGCLQQTVEQKLVQQPENQSSEKAAKNFRIVIGHTSYNPNLFEVNKGDAVTFFALAARGTGAESGFSHNHGITIDEYNINAVVASETTPTVVSFVADKAGTFSIYCRTCWDGPFGRGHPDIRATLVVK